ncbi:MAG: DUF3887 domain-containing protein [Candidatus Methanofastidiosia archaeon]
MIFTNPKKAFMVWFIILGSLVAGCVGQQLETPIEGEEGQAWIERAQPIAENILTSLETNDYESFIRDFSDEMRKSMPEEQFSELRDLLHSKVGLYQSFAPPKVAQQQNFVLVYFTAQYENDEVAVKLVFQKGDSSYKVQGLWFDSPKLRQ